jgi:hypothetical protein
VFRGLSKDVLFSTGTSIVDIRGIENFCAVMKPISNPVEAILFVVPASHPKA